MENQKNYKTEQKPWIGIKQRKMRSIIYWSFIHQNMIIENDDQEIQNKNLLIDMRLCASTILYYIIFFPHSRAHNTQTHIFDVRIFFVICMLFDFLANL